MVGGRWARATLESALERRETRGAHNRVDYPEQDPTLRVNLVWAPDGEIVRAPIAEPSAEIAKLAGSSELEASGRLLEWGALYLPDGLALGAMTGDGRRSQDRTPGLGPPRSGLKTV